MDAEQTPAGVGDRIYEAFFDALGSAGEAGKQLAEQLRTLRAVGELTREQTLVETFERLTRDPR